MSYTRKMISLFSWFGILSELFVNLSGAWFTYAFLEPQLNPDVRFETLTNRIFFGILTLLVAKFCRDNYEEYHRGG